jgi:hypothetical protein
LSKLSCAGWLPHDRGFVLELPLSSRLLKKWPEKSLVFRLFA